MKLGYICVVSGAYFLKINMLVYSDFDHASEQDYNRLKADFSLCLFYNLEITMTVFKNSQRILDNYLQSQEI